jgi:hypothetical protein
MHMTARGRTSAWNSISLAAATIATVTTLGVATPTIASAGTYLSELHGAPAVSRSATRV